MRVIRPILTGFAALVALVLLAAWVLPQVLDWSRYRALIEAVAGVELGRPVRIAGDVHLALLPHAVITARDVTIADEGDGVSAKLGSLRLEVALGALLGGRIVPQNLVLGAPALTLPWRVAGGAPAGLRPLLPRGFAARVEGGTLILGHVRLAGMNGAVTVDAESGALRAQGTANFLDRPWILTAELGHPGADGVAPFTIAVDGGGTAAHATTASVQGHIAGDGTVRGTLSAAGGDAALLLGAAAPHAAWRVTGPFSATPDQIAATALAISAGHDALTADVRIGAVPPALDLSITAARVNLQAWRDVLAGGVAAMGDGHLAAKLGRAVLAGGVARDVDVSLTLSGGRGPVRMTATLPGGGVVAVDAIVAADGDGRRRLRGAVTLKTADFGQDGGFLAHLLPVRLPAGLAQLPTSADLRGTLSLARGDVSVANLTGTVGPTRVDGGFGVGFGVQPGGRAGVGLGLTISRVDLTVLTAALRQAGLRGVGGLAAVDGDFHLGSPELTVGGKVLGRLALDVRSREAGVSIDKLAGEVAGLVVSGHGTVGADGAVHGARLEAGGADGSKLAGLLPAVWRVAPGLWQGSASFVATAEGVADALAVQARTDLGDLRAEAEGRVNTTTGAVSATLTARHPGAPRLLAALGVAGSEDWLGAGSFAARAQVTGGAGLPLRVTDADVTAASLIAGGDFTVTGDAAGGAVIEGHLHAGVLALPGLEAGLRLGRGWPGAGHLAIAAEQVTVDRRLVARAVRGQATLSGGVLALTDVQANMAGGTLAGEAAADFASPARLVVRFGLIGANLPARLTGWPLDIGGGRGDCVVDLAASGTNAGQMVASVSGDVHAGFSGATLVGMDLARLGPLLANASRKNRRALTAALTSGQTAGVSGAIDGQVAHGVAALVGGQVQMGGGEVVAPHAALLPQGASLGITGDVDLHGETVALSILPMVRGEGAAMAVTLSGGARMPERRVVVRRVAGATGSRRAR